ncbi:MAG: hypothetical protein ACKVP0_05425 [Pirellulaceae bacterium]
MTGFQIAINGKPLYTAGVGELGVMHACVNWACYPTKSGSPEEHHWIGTRTSEEPSSNQPRRYWPVTLLKIGDEVTIKIVEVESADPPLPGMPDYPPPESAP